jgi:hypothetical protein
VLHGKKYYTEQSARLQAVTDEVFGPGAFTAMSFKEALAESATYIPEWIALHA